MKKKRNYVSPLWLELPIGGGEIVVEGSVETGGTLGGECWSLIDMFEGQPAAKMIGCDGTLLGYYDIDEGDLYDQNGNYVDFQEWMGDFDNYFESINWDCYTACPQLADD